MDLCSFKNSVMNDSVLLALKREINKNKMSEEKNAIPAIGCKLNTV